MTFVYFYCSSQLLDKIPEDCEQVIDSEETDYNIADMDVSVLVDKFIEANVPVSKLLIEKHLPKTLLLPKLFEESLFDDCNLDDYLEDVKKDQVIADLDRLLLLFKKCLEKNCAGEIIQAELKFKGCNINVLWKCQNKHQGFRTFLKTFKNSAILIVFGKRA